MVPLNDSCWNVVYSYGNIFITDVPWLVTLSFPIHFFSANSRFRDLIFRFLLRRASWLFWYPFKSPFHWKRLHCPNWLCISAGDWVNWLGDSVQIWLNDNCYLVTLLFHRVCWILCWYCWFLDPKLARIQDWQSCSLGMSEYVPEYTESTLGGHYEVHIIQGPVTKCSIFLFDIHVVSYSIMYMKERVIFA